MIDPFTLAQTHPSLETHTPVQTHTMLEKTQALQEKAFERFFRIDRRSAGNSGLGLAIVKEICTALGARVSLQTPTGGNGLQVDIEFVAIS